MPATKTKQAETSVEETNSSEQVIQDNQLPVISDEVLGEFAVSDYHERLYPKVYYAIRERQGYTAKGTMDEAFNWEAFKEKFEEAFGTLEERKYTLEQMLDYARRKFGMTLDDLVKANKRSWERRRAWELQNQQVTQDINMIKTPHDLEEIPY